MILQTNFKGAEFTPNHNIGEWGCLFLVLIEIARIKKEKEINKAGILWVYKTMNKKNYAQYDTKKNDPKNYNKDGVFIKNRFKVVEIATGKETIKKTSKRKAKFIIQSFKTKNMFYTHFRLIVNYGSYSVIYDPYPMLLQNQAEKGITMKLKSEDYYV